MESEKMMQLAYIYQKLSENQAENKIFELKTFG